MMDEAPQARPRKTKMATIFLLFAAPFIVASLYLGFLWVSHDFDPAFLKIDSCLDDGGRWNYAKGVCER